MTTDKHEPAQRCAGCDSWAVVDPYQTVLEKQPWCRTRLDEACLKHHAKATASNKPSQKLFSPRSTHELASFSSKHLKINSHHKPSWHGVCFSLSQCQCEAATIWVKNHTSGLSPHRSCRPAPLHIQVSCAYWCFMLEVSFHWVTEKVTDCLKVCKIPQYAVKVKQMSNIHSRVQTSRNDNKKEA